MIRIPFVISVFISCAMASSAFAQGANGSSVSLRSGFTPQSRQVEAVGDHNVADSATLRARGCEGFVATEPTLSVVYDATGSSGAVVIRAESPTDLVMLIGTAANAWFCADDTVGTNPEITLPADSGSYSIWVGTRQKGRAQATVTLREAKASGGTAQAAGQAGSGGRCGEPNARIPMSVARDDWARFSCQTQESAGTRWGQCLGRTTYSDSSADGCPGAELCCPGVAPPPAPAKPTPPTPAQTGSSPAGTTGGGHCGGSGARIPMSMATEDWTRFTCQTQASAGTRWSQCQGRAAYSDSPADGCPGAELCCPYEGFNLAASQAKAKGTATSNSGTSTPSTVRPGNTNTSTPAAHTTLETSGTVATGASDQLMIEANPFGTRGGATVVYWRGFADAQIPVRTETREDAPTLYSLKGSDFPRQASDSLIVVKQTRRLRARTATSLNTSEGAIQIPAGQEVELLGPANATQCKLRIRQAMHVAACPHSGVFEGVGQPFIGLSPLSYQWWIAVDNESGQRGWVHIDLSRPEFLVVLPPSN